MVFAKRSDERKRKKQKANDQSAFHLASALQQHRSLAWKEVALDGNAVAAHLSCVDLFEPLLFFFSLFALLFCCVRQTFARTVYYRYKRATHANTHGSGCKMQSQVGTSSTRRGDASAWRCMQNWLRRGSSTLAAALTRAAASSFTLRPRKVPQQCSLRVRFLTR